LIRRAERELADGNRSARKTLERARRKLLKQRDTEGLEHLLGLASRLDDGRDLTHAIQQSLRLLSPEAEDKPNGPRRARMSRAAGPSWALAGVLTGHFLLGLAWLVVYLGTVFLTSSYTGWADLVLLLGGLCWLVALPLIVSGLRSGSHWYWGVPVAWVTVFAIATVLVVS